MTVCLFYSDNPEDAVEIMNDGFLKVFRSLDQQRDPATLKPWLRKIMVNTAIDYYRKYARQKDNQSITVLKKTVGESDESIYAGISAEEILKLVQQLPAALRLVFNLYVIEGYSHKEIARQLNIAESTSRYNLSVANARLRELLTSKRLKSDVR
jgi:RNA polymerase sigma factor (sigma-70 family)